MYYIKRTKMLNYNKWNGLTPKYAYILEKICLLILQNNYKCTCKNKKCHFPKIIKYYDNKFKFYLSNCGNSLDKIKIFKSIKKESILEQVDCIIENLKNNNIKHYDIRPPNICINDLDTISLIDFDYASYNNLYYSNKIKKKNNQIGHDYYKKTKEKILKILFDKLQ